ncbi:hypothetical protein EVAR_24338_1 [Eumeta japonica]|uniref:Uncharacterized protein n=1 Tax=Eumeta variegata TaxID=151549 RepID=A0A4C1VK33_EUMVA|nr:hypothetical protein EVAR_24338_1 [Eumeta japonica]
MNSSIFISTDHSVKYDPDVAPSFDFSPDSVCDSDSSADPDFALTILGHLSKPAALQARAIERKRSCKSLAIANSPNRTGYYTIPTASNTNLVELILKGPGGFTNLRDPQKTSLRVDEIHNLALKHYMGERNLGSAADPCDSRSHQGPPVVKDLWPCDHEMTMMK